MKKLLLILVLCGVVSVVGAETNVSGTIAVDSTFTIGQSPFVVTSSLTVNPDVTLTVDSGVVVQFNDGTSLELKGTLDAYKATFTSVNSSAERGDWNGIRVGYYADSAKLNLNSSSVLFATRIYMDRGIANIQNSYIQSCSEYGLLVDAGVDLNLSSTIISGNAKPMRLNGWPNFTLDASVDFQGNDVDKVEVYPSYIAYDYSLPGINVPYFFYYDLSIKNNSVVSVADDNVLLCRDVNVESGSTLLLGSEAVLKFSENYNGLNVYGTLTAVADADEFIYFTSAKDDNWGGDTNNDAGATDPASENWEGVRFYNSTSSASTMTRCKVRFAGYNDRGGITLSNSDATIDACDIATCYIGIYIGEASDPSISNTIIGSSDMTPIAMAFDANPTFANNQLSFSDNAYDAIGLIGGTMKKSGHIVKRNFTGIDNITYLILSKIVVPDTMTLTIDPGVVIKASTSYYGSNKNIVVEGTLLANGTSSEKIVFTSAKDDNHGNPGDTNKDGTTETPSVGDFGAIVFTPTSSSSSSLTHSIIKYARGNQSEYYFNQYVQDAAVITVNASPTISDNLIKDIYQGIRCYEASNPAINNNEVVNVSSTPFAISPSAAPTFSGNSFTNAGIMALGLLGGDMTQSGTLSKTNLAGYNNISYSLLYHLTVKNGSYMTIDPGVVIKANNSKLIVEGGLKINGTPTEKVIFTSIKDDNVGNPADANGDGNASSPSAGDWSMLRFEDTSDDDSCFINNAEFRYAGKYQPSYYAYYYSTIEISNANPTIKNTSIGQGLRFGVRIEGNAAPDLDNVSIQNMEYEPIGMSLTSNPTFSNMTFVANRAKGLAIIDANLSSDATLIKRDVAGVQNIAYVVNDKLTINPDAEFRINPGVNIKFRRSYGYIEIQGAMIADGTPDESIVFTSIRDDSRGGDTNNDGNTAAPELGDWRGLYFKSSGLDTLNVLDNVSVRYGGQDQESVSFNACTGKVSNSSIELSKGYGIEIIGSANPMLDNNNFYNIQKAPINMSMFAEPVFSGNSMSNVGRQAIQIIPETYSKTDTFPMRDFAGIDSITYCLLGNYIINDGTTITIPAGMVFKTTEELYWYYYGYPRDGGTFVVNGKLLVEGDASNPAVFTSFYDDTEGRPLDTGSDGLKAHSTDNYAWFSFENVSDDASKIDNALIKYGWRSIEIKSASPTITNSVFEEGERGVLMTGVSEPIITHNTFHNMRYSPMSISLVAYPADDSDNTISGSTYKVIEVNEETLTQDVNLPKRSFGGIPKIPYYFNGDYTVGTGAILTVDTGVVCKFNDNSQMNVQKGLIAKGASQKENNIVFTSIVDDFYGGDSNADSTTTSVNDNYFTQWDGLFFTSTSINESCLLDHCVFRCVENYESYSAIEANSASPTITNTSFSKVPNGVEVIGSGNPVINNCDFYDVKYYGVKNVDKSFLIDATNNWWGSNSGPSHTSNHDGNGVSVTDEVNFTPWKMSGAVNPLLGDVSQNGEVQAYDAALILKSTVGTYSLTPEQVDVADVTGNQGVNAVSALDASMVLRYSVGLINYFEATTLRSATINNAQLSIADATVLPQDEVELPITLDNVAGTYAVQLKVRYNPLILEDMEVVSSEVNGMNFTSNVADGYIYISMAGTQAMTEGGQIATLKFKTADVMEEQISGIDVIQFLRNEDDLTSAARSGIVIVKDPTKLTEDISLITAIEAYPNPFDRELNIRFNVRNAGQVSLKVYDQLGQMVDVLVNAQHSPGQYTMTWDGTNGKGQQVSQGIYFVKFITEEREQVLKVQMSK